MPFIQAVFCLKGFDDRSRFFASSIIALIGFILFSAIFSGYLLISFAIVILLTIVLTCSTIRRLHDAKLNKNWQLVPGGLFLVTATLSLFIESSSSYYLLILPALSSALLLTYPSKNNQAHNKYILGYFGPVDLSVYKQPTVVLKHHSQRIEPTLAGNGTHEPVFVSEPVTEHASVGSFSTESKQVDIGELIRLKFLSNRKLQLAVIASVALIFIGVFINSAIASFSQQSKSFTQTTLNQQQAVKGNESFAILSSKAHLLAMPDNFNLYLSAYQGIIIHWQADQISNGELWSLSTASGDKSCKNIKFNKGSSLRPLSVIVENGSEYFASFSPLDSKELVQALAFRGNFSLCGYNFSLRGSQAVLGKNAQYAHFLDKAA